MTCRWYKTTVVGKDEGAPVRKSLTLAIFGLPDEVQPAYVHAAEPYCRQLARRTWVR